LTCLRKIIPSCDRHEESPHAKMSLVLYQPFLRYNDTISIKILVFDEPCFKSSNMSWKMFCDTIFSLNETFLSAKDKSFFIRMMCLCYRSQCFLFNCISCLLTQPSSSNHLKGKCFLRKYLERCVTITRVLQSMHKSLFA
jgi:hypothetical protein